MNFADMFGKFSQMKQEMDTAKARLDSVIVEAEAGGNLVQVKMSASKKVQQIIIDPHFLAQQDKEGLEDLLCTAMNKAWEMAEERYQEEMGQTAQGMFGGMNLPNIPGLDLTKLGF